MTRRVLTYNIKYTRIFTGSDSTESDFLEESGRETSGRKKKKKSRTAFVSPRFFPADLIAERELPIAATDSGRSAKEPQ